MLGVDHPYEVKSDETPSLLPEGAVAVRFHSIGGWGAITTGKNLGAIIGDLNDLLYDRDKVVDEFGNPKEIIHVSANPKYGSEKKGAPTSYFMVAAPERIRVNCDLRHVTVVLCCDPKAFTHTNPLDGMSEGGALVWESEEEGEQAWERLPHVGAPADHRQEDPRLHAARLRDRPQGDRSRATCSCACRATRSSARSSRCRRCSQEFRITPEQFRDVVHKQYVKKFGRLGERGRELQHGSHDAGLRARARNPRRRAGSAGPLDAARRGAAAGRSSDDGDGGCGSGCRSHAVPAGQAERTPLTPDRDVRSAVPLRLRLQPAVLAAYASVGVMAAGSGDTASKYVARRETPLYIPENCTQCMECIAVCPDTALPNCSQDLRHGPADGDRELRDRSGRARRRCSSPCRRSTSARAS